MQTPKIQYRVVKEDIRDFYEIEYRLKENWLFWGEWQLYYFPKNLNLMEATTLIESLVLEAQRLKINKRITIKTWTD